MVILAIFFAPRYFEIIDVSSHRNSPNDFWNRLNQIWSDFSDWGYNYEFQDEYVLDFVFIDSATDWDLLKAAHDFIETTRDRAEYDFIGFGRNMYVFNSDDTYNSMYNDEYFKTQIAANDLDINYDELLLTQFFIISEVEPLHLFIGKILQSLEAGYVINDNLYDINGNLLYEGFFNPYQISHFNFLAFFDMIEIIIP